MKPQSLKECLATAEELWALERVGIITKAEANEYFLKNHGLLLFIIQPKPRRKSIDKNVAFREHGEC